MSLGRNIKRLRWEAGFREQKAFANHLGVPQPQLADWENDRCAVLGIGSLVKIAKALGCSVDRLLAGVDPGHDRLQAAGIIPVVADGGALPAAVAVRGQATCSIVHHVSGPDELRDRWASGVRIRDDSMSPAYRPEMVAIVSPARPHRRRQGVRRAGARHRVTAART